MKITNISIKQKTTVYVLIVTIIIMGLISYVSIPKELNPDITIPFVFVTTKYRGTSPKDIENSITLEIESKIASLENIKHIKSNSFDGMSQIFIEFNPGIEIDEAVRKVKDKVQEVRSELPADADDPVVKDINVGAFPIIYISLFGPQLRNASPKDKALIQHTLKYISDNLEDAIEKVEGVQDVEVVGIQEKEIKIEFDPYLVNAMKVPPVAVVQKILAENKNVSAGKVRTPDLHYSLRVTGEFKTEEDVGNLIAFTTKEGNPIYLKDIATIRMGWKDKDNASRLWGRESVSLGVVKKSGKNILKIAEKVRKVLEEERKKFPQVPASLLSWEQYDHFYPVVKSNFKKGFLQGIVYSYLDWHEYFPKLIENIQLAGSQKFTAEITNDQSVYVKSMVSDLENNLLSGLVLIILILFMFVGIRSASFVSFAVPLSMLITFVVLYAVGITLNMVVLFSLILVLGMLVDNAIVIVENIYRHRHLGYGPIEAAKIATHQVSLAVIASTATTVAAFIVMIPWPGIMGMFMSFLPKTVITALFASLFVALTINPTLCAYWLKIKKKDVLHKSVKKEEEKPSKFMSFYKALLIKAITYRKATMVLSFCTLIAMIGLYVLIGKGVVLFPDSDPERIRISFELPQGTSIEAMIKKVEKMENIIAEYEDVKHIITNIGKESTNKGEITMIYKDFEDRLQPSPKTTDEIRQRILDIATYQVNFKKEEMGPPTGAPINVEISGEEYDRLGVLAEDIVELVRNTEGAVDARSDFEGGKPEIKTIVDRDKATLYGISTQEIGTWIKVCYNGMLAGVYRTGDEEIDIRIQVEDKYRNDFNLFNQLTIMDSENKERALSSLINRKLIGGSGIIRRKDENWVVTVSANVEEGYIANNVLQDIIKELKKKKLPEGYFINFTGEQEHQKEASDFLSKAFIMALLLIVMILVAQFNSITVPFIIMTSVVLSLAGVMFGLAITGMPFSIIMTGVGTISLAGVVVNNAIVLIDYVRHLQRDGKLLKEAIIEAGITRLRPVLLTAATTIAGLIPMAIGWNFDFNEFRFITGGESAQWWGPMAIAVIFGLAFATVLTLVVVPVMVSLSSSMSIKLINWDIKQKVASFFSKS